MHTKGNLFQLKCKLDHDACLSSGKNKCTTSWTMYVALFHIYSLVFICNALLHFLTDNFIYFAGAFLRGIGLFLINVKIATRDCSSFTHTLPAFY